jgi:transposase
VLEAVLWILDTGAQWHMLPQSYPNYKTVHRRFQTWCRDEVLRRVLTDVANELIMAIVDRHGLPLSVSTHAANHHEVRLVQLCFDFYMIEAKPENLIGDQRLRQRSPGRGVAPRRHRDHRATPHQSQQAAYARSTLRRWLVERFFAWMQWQRRILVCWEYHTQNFLGFVPAPLSSSGMHHRQRGGALAPSPYLYRARN